MTIITDGMFKFLLVEAIFFSLWASFNALFVISSIPAGTTLTLDAFIAQSWSILSQPELVAVNSVLVILGIVGGLVIARELLPV